MVFGGFDNMTLTSSFVIAQDGQNDFKCDAASVGDLEDEDNFLVTGAFRQDTDNGIVVVCGQDFLHTFNEKTRTFATERSLE